MFWRMIFLCVLFSSLLTSCLEKQPVPTVASLDATEDNEIAPLFSERNSTPAISLATLTPEYPEVKLERTHFQGIATPLPVEVPWVLVDATLIALSENRPTINLDRSGIASEYISHAYLDVSDDGKQIAYTLRNRLVVEDLSTGEFWHYFYSNPDIWPANPTFSPDGTKLLFSSTSPTERVYFLSWIELESGELHPLYEYVPLKGVTSPQYFFDPTTLVDFGDVLGTLAYFPVSWTPAGLFGQIVLPFSDAGVGKIIRVDPFAGKVWDFPVRNVQYLLPSSDGEFVAYVQGKDLRESELFYQLNLVNVQTFQDSILIPGEPAIFFLEAWSPDNTQLLVQVSLDLDSSTIEALDLVDRRTGARSRLLFEAESVLGMFKQAVWLDKDTITLLFFDENEKENEVYTLPANNFNWEALTFLAEVPLRQYTGWIVFSPGGIP